MFYSMDARAGLSFVFIFPPLNIRDKVRSNTAGRGHRWGVGWAKWVKGVERYEALGTSWTAW